MVKPLPCAASFALGQSHFIAEHLHGPQPEPSFIYDEQRQAFRLGHETERADFLDILHHA